MGNKREKFKPDRIGDIVTIYLGDEPVKEWIVGSPGKNILMPEILHSTEILVNGTHETKLVAIIISEVDFKTYNYHFSVKRKNIKETLKKVMEWSLNNEEYEMCARVKAIQDKL